MIVLGTRLKESTCWRLTNQELRNGLWLAFGQTESRLPTNPNGCHITSSISHPQHSVLSFLLQSCLYINYIPADPTRGRWRVSSSQSCPWWSPPARLCTRTPRCQSSKSPALLLLLPGVKNLMSLKCELVDLDELDVFRKFIPLIRSSLTGECCFCYLFVDLVGPGEQHLQTRISAIVMESTGGSVAWKHWLLFVESAQCTITLRFSAWRRCSVYMWTAPSLLGSGITG